MSIKRVSCPGCNQSLNVPASMASTKCPSCGTVFSPSNPAAAAPAPAAKKLPESDTPRDPTQLLPWLVAGGVAALAVIGLIGLTFLSGGSSPNNSPAAPAAGSSEQSAVEQSPLPIPSEYRVVDLPESTRKSIHRDYKQMMASSFGKAKKVPKSGAAGQALRGMLQSTVEREVTHMALIHGVSEDDILQIVAEGEAKGW